MKKIWEKYSHIWLLSYGIFYFVWFFILEGANDRQFNIMHCGIDDMIPFRSAFIVPYLLWFGYVVAIILFTFFTSRYDYYRTCALLFIGMTVGLITFTIYPSAFDRGSLPDDNSVFASLVMGLRNIDTPTNVFPSLHVYNSIAVHIALMKNTYLKEVEKKSPKNRGIILAVKISSFILMVLICLATMFLKQHSFLDLAGGVVLVVILYPFVYILPGRFGKKKSKMA